MYSSKSTAAFNSTDTCNQKRLFSFTLSTAFDQKKKKNTCFCLNETVIQPHGELNVCAIHSEEKHTVGSRWSTQPVYENVTDQCSVVSERVGRGKLTVQAVLCPPSPSCNLLISHKFGIQAFT